MINRVLIRIKVVQILYSYLLVEKKFTLEEPAERPTKEKQFAYSLYMDMLALLVMISRQVDYRKGKPLENTRFIERVRKDDRVMGRVNKFDLNGVFLSGVAGVADAIKESGAFKMYIKDLGNHSESAEDMLWSELFNQIIMTSPAVTEYAAGLEGYTFKGLERMQDMVNETLTNFMASQDSLSEGLDTLRKSLDEARELYYRLLALAVDLTYMQERKLDEARRKFLRTPEDMNPNMRFVENRAVAALNLALDSDPEYRKYVKERHIDWRAEDPLMMESLLRSVVESDIYKAYMEAPHNDLKADAELWRDLYRKVILVNTRLLETLEDKSVFWNDDLDIMGTFVVKTFRRIEEQMTHPLLAQYKDQEDADFGRQLMSYVYNDKKKYDDWIREAVADSEWKMERLAFMDVVVIMTALAEIMHFPKIPLTVSINEYIEIAKAYSSPKSGPFVNGVLSTILTRLKADGMLLKQ